MTDDGGNVWVLYYSIHVQERNNMEKTHNYLCFIWKDGLLKDLSGDNSMKPRQLAAPIGRMYVWSAFFMTIFCSELHAYTRKLISSPIHVYPSLLHNIYPKMSNAHPLRLCNLIHDWYALGSMGQFAPVWMNKHVLSANGHYNQDQSNWNQFYYMMLFFQPPFITLFFFFLLLSFYLNPQKSM